MCIKGKEMLGFLMFSGGSKGNIEKKRVKTNQRKLVKGESLDVKTRTFGLNFQTNSWSY